MPSSLVELVMPGRMSALSIAYNCTATLSSLRLLKHAFCCPADFVRPNAGNSNEARMAMIEISTSNSMRVNPVLDLGRTVAVHGAV